MSRLSVIGNSHVGAIKDGWETIRPRWPGAEVDFFALAGHKFDFLAPDARRVLRLDPVSASARPGMVASLEKINGRTEIDLSGAGVVLWVGLAHPLAAIADILARFDIDGLRATGVGRPMSPAAFEAICDALIDAALPGPAWRHWGAPRLIVLPRHAPGATWLEQNNAKALPWGPLAANPDGVAAALDLYYRRFESRLAAIGIGMFRQPTATLTPCGLTVGHFARGSMRLKGVEHPETEVSHMNAEFGASCLDAFLASRAAAALPAEALA